MIWYKESDVTISDGIVLHKGIVAGRFIHILMRKKWMKFILMIEIHVFAKMYKAECTAPLGLPLGHVAFYKNIIKI